MMLQSLFHHPIRSQTCLDPGYSGHASDVWLVETDTERAVVRRSRITEFPVNDFQLGAFELFGCDPREVHALEPLNGMLAELSPVPVPRVLRKGDLEGRQAVVVERMLGTQLGSFIGQPEPLLVQLGTMLARIHKRRFDWCGHPTGRPSYALSEWPHRVAHAIRQVVTRYYPGWPLMDEAALALPVPSHASLVMPDLDPSQFLTDGERITALVDTEYYGVGPRELDFIALEYVLDAVGAAAVARGYSAVLPLPDLAAVRPVYRYLYLLMAIQGHVDLTAWMDQPHLF